MTAEQFLKKEEFNMLPILDGVLTPDGIPHTQGERLIKAMVNFAKAHVELALKEASDNVTHKHKVYDSDFLIDKESIINTYTLTKIK